MKQVSFDMQTIKSPDYVKENVLLVLLTRLEEKVNSWMRSLKGLFFHHFQYWSLSFKKLPAVPVEFQWRHCCGLSWQWFVLSLLLRLHQGIWFGGSCSSCAGYSFFVLDLIGCFHCPHTDLGHPFWLSWVYTSSQKQLTVWHPDLPAAFFVPWLFFRIWVLCSSALRT